MAFLETPRFPSCVSLGAIGGPAFSTDIVQTQGGQEYRTQVRSRALGRWEVSHLARLPEAWQELLAFWYIAAGQFNGFRFKDYLDFQVLAGQGVFVLLTATTFQMYKRYAVGASQFLRIIQKPISPATITGGTVNLVDYTTGIVTMTSGTPLSWTGEFDVPVRFGVDQLEQEAITRNRDGELMVDWRSIPLIEVRV